MKRFIYLALILAMLYLIAFPPVIYAGDSTRTPFDYLDSEEQAYVTNMRAWILVTKERVATAKVDLGTFFLQDYYTWYEAFLGELDKINDGIAEIKKLSAPPDFSGVGERSQGLNYVPVDLAAFSLSPSIAPMDIVSAAGAVAGLESMLTGMKQSLDSLWSSLDKRVNEVAEIQKRGEEAIEKLLESCEFRPARPY